MVRGPLSSFEPPVQRWFAAVFDAPTDAQVQGWRAIGNGESTLILAPTGSGKTLAAFLWALNRLMFAPVPAEVERCRVLYVSPLKALAVDVERNLRAPLVGIAQAAQGLGTAVHVPAIGVRSGDTPPRERARFRRHPPDILITTPESLFLLLTSNARAGLARVETVIVDEIHALVPTKRGAHLALSLERLEALVQRPLQRIGLSATQRPLDEVARFLGGVARPAVTTSRARRRRAPRTAATSAAAAAAGIHGEFAAADGPRAAVHRPVAIVDAGVRRPLELRVEVPVEDMARPGEVLEVASGPASATKRASIWTAIHPRLVELIRAHTSTLVFVNSRRLAERLAAAVNELAGEPLARSHHGSLAKEQRAEIEDQLKAGKLPALIATSSLELGIDMGAIDLVVQIESPSSVASGLQRIGRAGHRIDAASKGVIVPKFRGDLLAAAAVARLMREGRVEATRYPRNPLDVLAQQLVAMVALEDRRDQELFETVRRAAPFESLSRAAFDGVLDMLSGRYPSDDFAELRPRVTWNRATGALQSRQGSKRLAIANAGTIPDRGLYGVFLAGSGSKPVRVGELDEEMVFELKPGEVFLLGASSWRVDQVTHDRVLVTPAPGEPGKMPFWKGDRAGRPLETGLAIGELTRAIARAPDGVATERLVREHALDPLAAANLVRYVRDQAAASAVPDADTVVVERVRDELGDWRVCVLSPRGGRVHAPWCMAVAARLRRERGIDVETLWSDDGFVVRLPEADAVPDAEWMLPDPEEVEALVLSQLGGSALFAARFRENAGRSLLLPKRRPGQRAPLWQQRKKAGDLLAVASRFGSFPVVLETYRECLRDVFDMPALVDTLLRIRKRAIGVAVVDPDAPSPFAASLLFGYVANFLYDGDAPLAERRAQALSVDQAQLRELIGDAELRELLDAGEIAAVELQLQRLTAERRARSADAVHDLLLELGDLSAAEIDARCEPGVAGPAVRELLAARRVLELPIAGARRFVAIEDAARFRDALGVPLPPGVPQALRAPVVDPAGDLVSRFARTHGPFRAADVAERLGLPEPVVRGALAALIERGRVLEGEFRPAGTTRELVDANVLRQLRRRSLARLRKEVEPVEPRALARFTLGWHTIGGSRVGPDALLDVVDQLQGAPLPASILETDILPARLRRYSPEWLDTLAAAGEVRWVGLEPLGQHDGRIALYLTDQLPLLRSPPERAAAAREREANGLEQALLAWLQRHGASFFDTLSTAAGGGFPGAIVDALWALVWRGIVTNDTFHALRAYTRWRGSRLARSGARDARDLRGERAGSGGGGERALAFRSRRAVPRTAEGRWTLVHGEAPAVSATERLAHQVRQLLARHGVLTREALASEGIAGGFGSVYPALKAMDDAGRVRRGYFVAGLGATQFALPAALEQLRALREPRPDAETALLAATDPANPFGTSLPWPRPGLSRSVGARVVVVDGALTVYVARGHRELAVELPADEPFRTRFARAAAARLAAFARGDDGRPQSMLIASIDDRPAAQHPFAPFLEEAGFVRGAAGFHVRRASGPLAVANAPDDVSTTERGGDDGDGGPGGERGDAIEADADAGR
jgi:ATP-dependent Lhr-like helicase